MYKLDKIDIIKSRQKTTDTKIEHLFTELCSEIDYIKEKTIENTVIGPPSYANILKISQKSNKNNQNTDMTPKLDILTSTYKKITTYHPVETRVPIAIQAHNMSTTTKSKDEMIMIHDSNRNPVPPKKNTINHTKSDTYPHGDNTMNQRPNTSPHGINNMIIKYHQLHPITVRILTRHLHTHRWTWIRTQMMTITHLQPPPKHYRQHTHAGDWQLLKHITLIGSFNTLIISD